MKTQLYHVIGVMSGTSLDGIDLAYVQFELKEKWRCRVLATETFHYTPNWKRRLGKAVFLSDKKLKKLNKKYTEFLGETILRFIGENHFTELDAVCSHGHTVKHKPKKGITFQIGNLPFLAKIVGKTVVCDFRKQDVLLGGQGAPLVPIGDEYLFSEFDFCVNLGGFANLSTKKSGKRTAYDICAVNTVLNVYAEKMGFDFDENGNLAASGKIDETLLHELNRLSFYKQMPPKSLGIEWVNLEVFPLLEKSMLATKTILATYTAHCAFQIAKALGNDRNKTALFTGGGTYNKFLMGSIENYTETQLIVPEENLIEYKEALIFGLLGILKLREENNVLGSVTGASKDHSSGVVFRN